MSATTTVAGTIADTVIGGDIIIIRMVEAVGNTIFVLVPMVAKTIGGKFAAGIWSG